MSSGFAHPVQPESTRPLIVQATALSERLQACFATLRDPRVERTHLHLLSDIVTISILSILVGGEGWEDMELYGISKQAWLSTFLAPAHGIPSEDTFRPVFERIDPQQFEPCFRQWVNQLVDELKIRLISVDGKADSPSTDHRNRASSH
jgi:hypothetical protein